MPYSNANNVDITPDIGFEIVSPAGIPSDGLGITLGIAFTPAVDATNDMLCGLVDNSGNHWVKIGYLGGMAGGSTTSTIEIQTRAGGGGTVTNSYSTATVAEGAESIIMASITSVSSRAIVIDSNAYETFSPTSNGTPANIDTFEIMQKRGTEFLPGNIAWAAVWFSVLAQSDMEDVADGTAAPTDKSPNEFIWFNGTTAYSNEAETQSPTTIGTGSLAVGSNTYPGWPPASAPTVPYVRPHAQRIVRHSGRFL